MFESPKEPTTAEANRSTAKPQPTAEGRSDTDKPKVLIDDAGIGGLFLRNILLKAKSQFTIAERGNKESGKVILAMSASLFRLS